MTRNALFAAALMLILTITAPAHHSFAGQFDPNSSIEIQGELIEVHWTNPHAHLKVRTVEKGQVVVWDLETAGPSQMVIREYLVVGDKVRVAGWPPLTAAREIHATNLLTSNGRELILFRGAKPVFTDRPTGSYDYATKREGDRSRPQLGLFRIWSFTAVSTFLLPEDVNTRFNLNTYPMTDAARHSVATGSRMDYTVTVTDPVNFTKPVTLNRYFLDLGETIVPYKCNERK